MKLLQLVLAIFIGGVLRQAAAVPTPTPSPSPSGSVVRMATTLGNIDIWLRSDIAPLTVQNFLTYVTGDISGSYYNNSFFHRSVRLPDVIQGGGYKWNDAGSNIEQVKELARVMNESSTELSNVRGTIAMALQSVNGVTDINSATNQWYFNVGNNSAALDHQAFTVFGTVINNGMNVVDAIAALPVENQSVLNPAFGTLPLINHVSGSSVTKSNLALISTMTVLSYDPPVQTASGQYASLGIYSLHGSDTFLSAPNPAPDSAPPGVTFPEGFFQIGFAGLTNGATVRSVLRLPPGATPNTYYKYGPTPDNHSPHWYNFMWDGKTGAVFENTDPTRVALTFVDGERGDDDLTADGKISDVGGPGIAAPATSSSGGGGALDWLSLCAGLMLCLQRVSIRRFS